MLIHQEWFTVLYTVSLTMRTVNVHQNKCTVLTDNTTVYMFTEESYSNLSFKIKLMDMCTRLDKTIYSSLKIQVNWLIIL